MDYLVTSCPYLEVKASGDPFLAALCIILNPLLENHLTVLELHLLETSLSRASWLAASWRRSTSTAIFQLSGGVISMSHYHIRK